MSDEIKDAPKGPQPSKLPLILLLVNFLVIAGGMGLLVYTRLIFKRPVITEDTERQRLAVVALASPKLPAQPDKVDFDPITVNIAPDKGKAHYATIAFSLEIRDKELSGDIEAVRPQIMDRFLTLVGRKQFSEINNVQGRFVLRSELIDAINKLIFENAGKIQTPQAISKAPAAEEGGAKPAGKEGEAPEAPKEHKPTHELVTNIFFSQFIVQ